ncbi:MAG TPA: DUF1707 domain-containing protein [Trebonia sp.]|jgi:hypothetical protein
MDTQSNSFPRGDFRVSDAERDQAVAELSEHFQAGRISQEEFEDRSGRALQARTRNDLSGLFTDLPHGAVAAPRSVGSAAGPGMSPGGLDRVSRVPVGGVILTFVLAAIILGALFGSTAHGHDRGGFGFLVPVVILGLVFLRRVCRR